MVMTFRPAESVGPLFYGGMPDVFNTTIGYFGPSAGDGEGVDPNDADFDGFGEGLSDRAQRNLSAALGFIEEFLEERASSCEKAST